MSLALLTPNQNICPQCGENWGNPVSSRLEFCPRCGSPVSIDRYDPLRTQILGKGLGHINKSTKLIVKSGVWIIGAVGLLTGLIMFYGGWFGSSLAGIDPVQLWVSRIGGPALLIQGLFYVWIPFRRPKSAVLLKFPRSERKSF